MYVLSSVSALSATPVLSTPWGRQASYDRLFVQLELPDCHQYEVR